MKYYLLEGIENYTNLCTIETDLSYLPLSPRLKSSGEGTYYGLEYDVILVWSDRVRGYDRLEGGSRSSLSFISYIFIHKMLSGC